MDAFILLAGLLAYVVAGRLAMRGLTGRTRELMLAVLNLMGCYYFLFFPATEHPAMNFGALLALVILFYLAIHFFAGKHGGWPWLAFFVPIAALVVIRYMPFAAYAAVARAFGKTWHHAPYIVGISYLAFRCSRLLLEIRNGSVKKPGFTEYLNFALFVPTMPVGPINTYANFRRGFTERYEVPVGRASFRILVGAVKYQFLGNLCNELTYQGYLLNGFPHAWCALPVAMLFFYLYLYLNFSGFCDMAIGAAALIGIPVPENFDNPFAARNVKDFWTRWHITLSTWMRDIVFSPLSKFFVGKLGIKMADHAIALTIVIVFLLVGVWHGAGWNFVAYGAAHALGVGTNHYYTIFLKRKLGREKFKAYNENRWIRAVAVGLTFCYCGASLIFFANTFPQIGEIFRALR
jgi:D-alanyl-lipoteichoic acid acyltransferase DltB (MBOAT superfamily)